VQKITRYVIWLFLTPLGMNQVLMTRNFSLFLNFLFTCLLAIKIFFIIALLFFPLFNVIVSIFILSYVNSNLHVPTIYTKGDKSLKRWKKGGGVVISCHKRLYVESVTIIKMFYLYCKQMINNPVQIFAIYNRDKI
jgi:hypothetical protein